MQLDPRIQKAINEHMQSSAFLRFLDEGMLKFAEVCVFASIEAMEKKALEAKKSNVKKIKKSQLHSIPAVVQAGGMNKLKELAEKQSEKQSKPENSAFWGWFRGIISPSGDAPENSLPEQIRLHLQFYKIELPDPKTISEKKEAKTQRKMNSEYINLVMEKVLPVFCEHFICHYSYQVTEER